ncbi:MAG: Cache 3/Cache 2 fusion domain-containing protein [Clostridiaceae bacterium]|nr:Cache 3/Cache 2 fusion domain-containing protein [Clostridiaceae bacterium]MBW4859198.1 Cache 3/Cache 2 fusion domain-containing protein [Clostridiaceae bacterium]MBW4868694.1 Cache 3/Cache 2 fusion domain-containing protein [Clostridiaceae bacterium]
MEKSSFGSRVILVFFSFIIFLLFLFTLIQIVSNNKTVESIMEENLDKLVNEKKEFLDLRMKGIERTVEDLGYIIYEYSKENLQLSDERYMVHNGMVVDYKDEDKTSLFIPKDIEINEKIKEQINFTKRIEDNLERIIERNKDISCVYLLSVDGVLRVYPYMNLNDLEPCHDFRDDHYFKIANEKLDPNRNVVWTKPYYDWAGRGWIVTCVYPVYIDNELSYVVFADVTLKWLQETIADFQIEEFGYSFLIDYDGEIIYHPNHKFEPLGKGERLYENIFVLNQNNQYKNILKNMVKGEKGKGTYYSSKDKKYNLVSYESIERLKWSIGFDVNKDEYALNSKKYISQYFIFPIIMASIILALGCYLLKKISEPIQALSTSAEKMASGEFLELKDIKGGKEIEILANSLNTMSWTLKEYMNDLIRTNMKLEALFNSIKGLLYTVNEDYEIVSINSYGREITKTLKKDPIGCKCYEFFKNSEKPCQDCPIKETMNTYKESFREMKFKQDILHVWTFPIFDDEGKLDEIVVYSMKATEKAILEREFYQREKLASIGQMAAGVTHELKNPLSVIKGCNYLLKSVIEVEDIEEENRKEIKEIIDEINNSIDRSENIIYNLLDFSRKSNKEKEEINLEGLINQLFILNKKYIIEQDIEIYLNFHSRPLNIQANLDSMKHVFLNIIENAIQAMPDGGKLKVEGQEFKNKVQIIIEDSGYGIKEEVLKEIFKPFFTTKPRGIGTGIGLWIVKNELKENNGDIEVSSTIDKGTKVIVYFSKDYKGNN